MMFRNPNFYTGLILLCFGCFLAQPIVYRAIDLYKIIYNKPRTDTEFIQGSHNMDRDEERERENFLDKLPEEDDLFA